MIIKKMEDRPQESVPRISRSKRSPSRIHKVDEEKVSLDPAEIDELITDFYETRTQLQELERTEKRLRVLIHRLLDVTNSNIIKGGALEVNRTIQKRRTISKADVPADLFEQYCRVNEVSILRVKPLK